MRIFYYLFAPAGEPHFSQAIHYELSCGVMQAARDQGATLVVAPPGLDLPAWLARGEWRNFDGALGTVPARAERLMQAWNDLQELLPCVNLLGGSTRPKSHYVRCDEAAGVNALVDCLRQAGHRHLGYLGMEAGMHADLRYRAFLSALKRHAIESHDTWIATASEAKEVRHPHPPRLEPLGRTQATPRWHERSQAALAWWIGRKAPTRPSAVVCESDRMAWMLWRAARQQGLEVPRDLALTGFDDQAIPFEPWGYNILTTIRQDFSLLGRRAVEVLTDILNRTPRGPRIIEIPGELIVRRSTRIEAQVLPSTDSDARFRRIALEVLETAEDDRSAVQRLAAALDLSPAYVRTRFRQVFGRPLAEHLARARIEGAAFLLTHTARPITEIHTGLGFRHHQVFVKFFKRWKGCTPQVWRRRASKGI